MPIVKAKDRFEKVLLSDRTMRRIGEKIKRGISRFNSLSRADPTMTQVVGFCYLMC
jgi:hypothetical protein